jgi:ATP synthase protein I
MFRAIVHQALAVVALAMGCLATQRWEVAVSAFIGGTCIVLPNLLFAIRLSANRGRSSDSYPTVFFVGELVKLLATIGLMAIAAVYVVWLVWPAMIAGIVLAANAPWLVQMLIRQKAGNGR